MSQSAAPSGFLFVGLVPLWEDRGDAIHLRELLASFRTIGCETSAVVRTSEKGATPVDCAAQVSAVPFAGPRGIRQLVWNLKGGIAALQLARRQRVDVVYSRLEPGNFVGWFAAKMLGRPLVIELNGLPSRDVQLHRPNSRLAPFLIRAFERMMYGSADMIVGAPGYIRYATESFGVSPEKCFRSPLAAAEIFRPENREVACARLGLSAGPRIVWTGQIAQWQGLETAIAAMPLVRQQVPGATLLIVGDGSKRAELERLAAQLQADDAIQFTGRVKYDVVPSYIASATVCVATFPGNRGQIGMISSLKTASYLACGRPVVTTAMDELATAIQHEGAGVSVPPDEPAALAAALVALLTEPGEAHEARASRALGLGGGPKATWHHAAASIRSRIEQLGSGRGR